MYIIYKLFCGQICLIIYVYVCMYMEFSYCLQCMLIRGDLVKHQDKKRTMPSKGLVAI